MTNTQNPSLLKVMLFMGLFVLLGLPLVAILWETLNDILALKAVPQRLLLTLPVVLLFAGLLYFLKRGVRRIYPDSLDPNQ